MKSDLIAELSRRVELDGKTPFPRISPAEMEEAERRLGFMLPPLLRDIYLKIGDGGFGPGCGLVPIKNADSEFTLVAVYEDHKAGAKYLGGEWDAGVLPFVSWGCAIYTCVDCADEGYRIHHSESSDASRRRYSLETFIERWAQGKDVFTVGDYWRRPKVR